MYQTHFHMYLSNSCQFKAWTIFCLPPSYYKSCASVLIINIHPQGTALCLSEHPQTSEIQDLRAPSGYSHFKIPWTLTQTSLGQHFLSKPVPQLLSTGHILNGKSWVQLQGTCSGDKHQAVLLIPWWDPGTKSPAGHSRLSGKADPQLKWRLESWLHRPGRSFPVRVPTLLSWPFPFCFPSIHSPLIPPPPGLCAVNIVNYWLFPQCTSVCLSA